VDDAFDEHGIRRHDERDVDAALEPGHLQSRQDVVALRAPQRERRKAVAEIDDAANVAVRSFFARMRRDIFMQLVNVSFGKWCENDLHKRSLRLLLGAAGLDAV
jgi:hypothetical protein